MSAIASFYKNKTIFISGGTGFIGKLLIEQLLRKTEPRRLYLLIREKKGESSYVRKEKIFQNVVFDHLKATKPNYLEKVSTIPGDLTKKNLGISEEDIERICDETEVVIHGGATVSMSELLKPVIDVNLKGSLSMMALGQKIKNLQAFALISTAYSFCPYPEIKEELNNIHIKPDELINLVDNLTEAERNAKLKDILGKWPNPYTLSKALVETAVKDHAKDLPLAIIRPSIIMGTYSEPVPGWIDNYYGPTGYMSAFATGIVRPVNVNPKEEADLVPGDMVASCTLAAAYKTSLSQRSKIKPIYNLVAYKDTRLNWEQFCKILVNHPYFPSTNKMIWKNKTILISNAYLFQIYELFYNIIPLASIDMIYKFRNKKSRLIISYKKVRYFMDGLTFFATRSWNFSNDNTVKLWNELSDEDKRLFNFNTKCIDWQSYLTDCFTGTLKYLLRQTPDLDNRKHLRTQENRQMTN